MDGLQNRMESTEQRISELEIKQQKVLNLNIREKIDQKKKMEQSLGGLWEYNTYLTFMSSESQVQRIKGGAKHVFEEIITENSPKLAKPISIQFQEAEQSLNRVSIKKFMPRQISQTS